MYYRDRSLPYEDESNAKKQEFQARSSQSFAAAHVHVERRTSARTYLQFNLRVQSTAAWKDKSDTMPPALAGVSLAINGGPAFVLRAPPQGVRAVVLVGAAVVSGLVFVLRRAPADAIRKRVIRRLDRIAPRVRYSAEKESNGDFINGDCPVCLCEFASAPERPIRVLKCRHALCSDCLESWAVHCTKAHLDPTRFGVTRRGQVVSWSPGPNCPLCKSQLKCVPDEDLREAIIAAIEQRGAAISTFIAYQSQASNSQAGAH